MLKRGGCKSKYFHVVMRVKRKNMFVHKMLTKKEEWLQGDDNITRKSGQYYKNTLTGKNN